MGYATSYELKVDLLINNKIAILKDSSPLDSIILDLREENEEAMYALDEAGGTMDSCKWYEHQDDLRKFSLKHPNILFTLSGEGEEAGDMWKEYYVNGKLQVEKAKIQIAEFNSKELK